MIVNIKLSISKATSITKAAHFKAKWLKDYQMKNKKDSNDKSPRQPYIDRLRNT